MGKSGVSLEEKVKRIAACAGAVVFFSIGANLAVSWFGLGSFGSILEQNAGSLAFWSAMEEERLAFARYVGTALPEERERFEQSRMETRRRLEELPVDYRETGSERYARTWSIRNMYENYETELEVLEETDREDPEYVNRLYRIYRVQNYLKDKAGQLEQMTMEDGSERYEKHRFLFSVLPAASILWGIAALWMVKRLNGSVRRNIVEPVVMLAGQADRIRKNDFSGPELTAEGEDEISRLIRSFNKMKQATRGYIEALKEKNETERQLEAVRLQLLKNQINPHFLFNTLNMIAGTAQIEDAAATEKMIQALSRLFRYNLKSTASVMPLERELKVVQDYMYLQQMRFGERISYQKICRVDADKVIVPAFTFQPLVENAIIHGLSKKEEGGTVRIHIWQQGEFIFITIGDDGLGMDDELLMHLRRELAKEDGKTGIGLGNIYRRIHAMYQDGNVEVYSRKDAGTVIKIQIRHKEVGEEDVPCVGGGR